MNLVGKIIIKNVSLNIIKNLMKDNLENKFILIAGPCVIESKQLVFEIAEKIKRHSRKNLELGIYLNQVLTRQTEVRLIPLEVLDYLKDYKSFRIKKGIEFRSSN